MEAQRPRRHPLINRQVIAERCLATATELLVTPEDAMPINVFGQEITSLNMGVLAALSDEQLIGLANLLDAAWERSRHGTPTGLRLASGVRKVGDSFRWSRFDA